MNKLELQRRMAIYDSIRQKVKPANALHCKQDCDTCNYDHSCVKDLATRYTKTKQLEFKF